MKTQIRKTNRIMTILLTSLGVIAVAECAALYYLVAAL